MGRLEHEGFKKKTRGVVRFLQKGWVLIFLGKCIYVGLTDMSLVDGLAWEYKI